MKVASVQDVFMTDQAVTIGIKTNSQADEPAIREILRKNRSEDSFAVTVPAEKASS